MRGDELLLPGNLARVGTHQSLAWLQSTERLHYVQGDFCKARDVDTVIAEFRPEPLFHIAAKWR